MSWQDLCTTSLQKRSLGKISERGRLARYQQISMQRLCTRSLYEISAQAINNSSLGTADVRDHLARSLQQILCNVSVQDLHKRCPGKILVQDLYKSLLARLSKRSLYKLSIRALLARSVQETSWQDSGKIPLQDLYKSSLCKISAQALYKRPPCQDLCARSPWASKLAPCHNESDLTRPKCREGCASTCYRCSQNIAGNTKSKHWKSKKKSFT